MCVLPVPELPKARTFSRLVMHSRPRVSKLAGVPEEVRVGQVPPEARGEPRVPQTEGERGVDSGPHEGYLIQSWFWGFASNS